MKDIFIFTVNDSTPKACSTCYFRGPKKQFYHHEDYCGFDSIVTDYYHVCTRTNQAITNDAPCSNWQKK